MLNTTGDKEACNKLHIRKIPWLTVSPHCMCSGQSPNTQTQTQQTWIFISSSAGLEIFNVLFGGKANVYYNCHQGWPVGM